MNTFSKVTFTAISPHDFRGKCFRRRRFIPMVEKILMSHLPFPLEYPAKISVTWDEICIQRVIIRNNDISFQFTLPRLKEETYIFDDILIEEFDNDTKNVTQFTSYGMFYAEDVPLSPCPTTPERPFKTYLLVMHNEITDHAKHYERCKNLLCQIQGFLKASPNFSFLDAVALFTSTFAISLADIYVLNISNVITFYNGKLADATSYFDNAKAEIYLGDDKEEITCASSSTTMKTCPDGCFLVSTTLKTEEEKHTELIRLIEFAELIKKHANVFCERISV